MLGCESTMEKQEHSTSSISRLPLELLLEVIRYVDLEDYFILKRTDRWLYKMLRDVPPSSDMLSPWLFNVNPRNLVEDAQIIQSYQNLQCRVIDLPIKDNVRDFRISGTIACWGLDAQSCLLRDFKSGKERVVKLESKIRSRDFSASRIAIATEDQTIHILDRPLESETPARTVEMTMAIGQIDELAIAGASTIILRDRANGLWYLGSDFTPKPLKDVNHRWDLVLLDMSGTTLYLLRNEGRRGISYESVCLSSSKEMKITKHPAQTVGTIQDDEESHDWINRHSRLWTPSQPVYFIHSACPSGERLQIIHFNPNASPGCSNFVTNYFYEHRIRSFCVFGPFLLYDHLGTGAKEQGLTMHDIRTGQKRRFLAGRDMRKRDFRISEGGDCVYWRKSARRMTVLCFNRVVDV